MTADIEPTAEGFGVVCINFMVDYLLDRRPGGTIRSALMVTLRSDDGQGFSFDRAVPNPSGAAVVIDGVPIGRYTIEARAANDVWQSPIGRGVEVVDAGRITLTCELKGYGGLEIVVPDGRGEDSQTTSCLLKRQGDPDLLVVFHSPPFIIEGLAGGPYKLRVRRGNPDGREDGTADTDVFVRAGAIAIAEVGLKW